MKQYKTNIATVMNFLIENEFSASVISLHKQCYKSLEMYLLDIDDTFSSDVAYQWIESNKSKWSYRKYTGWKHCIDQLCDIYTMGYISLDHLVFRKPPYVLLNEHFKAIIDIFINDEAITDTRYRITCSRFLLFLQNNSINDISELDYDIIIKFHNDDYHSSSKSKDTYEDLIRRFLRYLAANNICSIGLSLALNKLLINKILKLDLSEFNNNNIATNNDDNIVFTWDTVSNFLDKLSEYNYGKTVLKASKHILTLLFIFMDMHQITINPSIIWFWFYEIKPLLGSGWKQHRRTLCQFIEFLTNNVIITGVIGNPIKKTSVELLPVWQSTVLKSYLHLLKREGYQKSSISMYNSSILRFYNFLNAKGITHFSEITINILKDFNLQDKHSTPEGKGAYNCRIRHFLMYLHEQGIIQEKYLYKVLISNSAPRTKFVEVLSKEEQAYIMSVNPDELSPIELRDYAIVYIGLTMGFRASDIISLQFNNIDWKEKSITKVQQKTGKLITIPLPIKTGNILFKYIRDGRPLSSSSYIFIRHSAPYNNVQSGVCSKALKRFINNSVSGFHIVRKTFATNLLISNTKIETISDSLGHTTDSTVNTYLAVDEEHMKMCPLSLSELGIEYKGGVFYA